MERRRSEHVLGEDAFGEDIIMDSMAKDSFGDLDPDHKHGDGARPTSVIQITIVPRPIATDTIPSTASTRQ